jgi:hypothetical protein
MLVRQRSLCDPSKRQLKYDVDVLLNSIKNKTEEENATIVHATMAS